MKNDALPIIMSAPMVLAMPRKTQTRRTTGLEDIRAMYRVKEYGRDRGRFGVLFEDEDHGGPPAQRRSMSACRLVPVWPHSQTYANRRSDARDDPRFMYSRTTPITFTPSDIARHFGQWKKYGPPCLPRALMTAPVVTCGACRCPARDR